MTTPVAGTLPLIIGVTGHRDLLADHVPSLESAIGELFAGLRERYPCSSLVLLSPLAEGADRLAARVALKAGIRLIVPLPMPRSVYELDFATAASRAEFAELFDRAESCINLPLLPGSSPEAIRTPGRDRDREYAKVGAYIATHSDIFVALWDGVDGAEDELVGGTSQVVQFRLSGVPQPYGLQFSPLLAPSGGAVDHILTPRASNAHIENAFTRSMLLPAGRTEESIARLLRRLDLFNRDAHELRDEIRLSAERSRGHLVRTDTSLTSEVVGRLPAGCAPVLDQYAVADVLSVHFGRTTLRASKRIFIAVCVAAVLLNLHSFFYHPFLGKGTHESVVERLLATPWFLLCFLALSAFTVLRLHRAAVKGEYQHKHQDYRALAEALRVQFFWLVAGIGEPVAHRYLQRHRSDLEWIRSALFSSCVLMDASRSSGSADSVPWGDRLRFLHEHWIVDQRSYYASRAAREQRVIEKEKSLSGWLLRASVALTGAYAATLLASLVYPSPVLERLREWAGRPGVAGTIEFVMVICAVCAGLLLAYGNQMARAEHIRAFTRMSELFEAGERDLADLLRDGRREASGELVRDLGKEALDESGDWLILHRERPLEVPHAG